MLSSRFVFRPAAVVLLVTVLLACCCSVQVVLAQAPAATPVASPAASPSPSASVSSTRPSSSAAAAAPSTSAAPVSTALPACGSSPGAIFITNPVSSTYAAVGSSINVTWTYSSLTLPQYPAKGLVVYYQRSDTAITEAGWQVAVANIPPQSKTVAWTIPSLQDGKYEVHVVADGVDPIARPASSVATCVPDGMPGPESSQQFVIQNAAPLVVYPDTLGPNSNAPSNLYLGSGAVLAAAGFAALAFV
ncbi:hypothetical protein HKX48_009248 [Thoreauomyces humboldtii]|nr:hypothetical protein HKX48_009248 [Thoreauomyces humboldtii]